MRCDVSSPQSVAELRSVVADFSGADILVHNADLSIETVTLSRGGGGQPTLFLLCQQSV